MVAASALALGLSACGAEGGVAPLLVPPPVPVEASPPQAVAVEDAPAPGFATTEASPPAEVPADYPTGQPTQLQAFVPPSAVTGFGPDPTRATVVVDPGHGGAETGAAGFGLVEKVSNLDMALRVETLLAAEGLRVILTRRADTRVTPDGFAGAGFSATRTDLQTRIDIANAAEAAVFVSIHSNAHGDASLRGVEVYANSLREHAAENRALGSLVLQGVLGELAGIGQPAVNRGVRDDSCLRQARGVCRGLFLLSPARVTTREEVIRRNGDPVALGFPEGVDEVWTRASEMPAVLVELLFLSNAEDAAMLKDEAVRDAMARGIASGVLAYLEERGLWPR